MSANSKDENKDKDEGKPFVSKIEELLPATELTFDSTPGFGKYKGFFPEKAVCFDTETEILTSKGWKKYNEITPDEFIAALNPKTEELEYQKITNLYVLPYKGKMYCLKTKSVDIMVTPNHRLYIAFNRYNQTRKLIPAKECFGKAVKHFKRNAKWNGNTEIKYFILPSIQIQRSYFGQIALKILPEKKIPIEEWCEFFGFWLAEGSVEYLEKGGHYVTILDNKNISLLERMRFLLSSWGFEPHLYNGNNIFTLRVNNKQLASYLKQFGHAQEKYIPDFIKTLPSSNLQILLDWYLKGDGTLRFDKKGKRMRRDATTVSKRLADDLQEIALKVDLCATITKRDRRGRISYSNDKRLFRTKSVEYNINFSWQTEPFIQNKQHKNNIEKWVEYQGIVWCVTVPNQIIYVRRNGKPLWSGNSHPAKMNTNLLEYLVLRYSKEGDLVLDPMCGSGSTLVVSALHNRNAIGIELETKFYEWCLQAKANVEKHQTLLPKGTIEVIQGDARNLSTLLKSASTIITSPPYSEGIGHAAGANASTQFADRLEMQNRYTKQMTSEGNIAKLKHGNVDTIITSPPYSEGQFRYKLGIKPENLSPNFKGRKAFIEQWEMEYSEDNITKLKYGNVDTIITSPPYSEGIGHGGGRQDIINEKNLYLHGKESYSESDTNIGVLPHGTIDTIITSPPYSETLSMTSGGMKGRYGLGKTATVDRKGNPQLYSTNASNIGNLEHGIIDVIVTSPPYADSKKGKADVEKMVKSFDAHYDPKWNSWGKTHSTTGRKRALEALGSGYGESEQNIGNLQYGNVDTIITSPPYSNSYLGGGDSEKRKERLIKAGYDAKDYLGGTARNSVLKHYSESEPESKVDDAKDANDVDIIITSPPYSGISSGGHISPHMQGLISQLSGIPVKEFAHDKVRFMEAWKLARQKMLKRYSDDSANIGNLQHGNVDAIITSPPYSNSPIHDYGETNKALLDFEKQLREQLKANGYIEYKGKRYTEAEWRALNSGELKPRGIPELWAEILKNANNTRYNDDNPDNIANLPQGDIDAIITSPPYMEAQQGGGIAKKGYHDSKHASPDMIGERTPMPDKFTNPDNIFNMKKETYLEAMFKVYQEMYKVLKPGGKAVIVVKPFVRRKVIMDLPYETWLLLKKAGFQLYEVQKLKLSQMSFWRILYYKKYPDVPRLSHEYVIVVQKP